MKKRLAFIALILVISILGTTACSLIPKKQNTDSPAEETPETPDTNPEPETPEEPEDPKDPEQPEDPVHTHEFIDGKCECGEEDPDYVKPEEKPEVLNPTTIYIVGDSTVCSFSDSYYYPRYGYGTQLANYLAPEATVVNLALSGRSSKSFLAEANYQTLKSSLKEGDYLIIGFGHNDEKSDDAARFTDASKSYTEEGSFGYYLYNYYVKLAEEAGATAILCTPIVRAKTNNDYSGNEGHVTATGDYAQAIRDLGKAVNVDVVDLTAITKAEYSAKGYDVAKLYHAVTAGMKDGDNIVPNWGSVDNTHLNIYGAKFVAYNLAAELQKLSVIGWYVLDDIAAPTEADLVVNPSYVYSDYAAPDLGAYNPVDHFTTITDGWYGTGFGDTGGDPASASNGYIAKEIEEGVFHVGQHLDSGSNKGKFADKNEGYAFLFRQVEADKNFKITATGKILYTGSTKQAGFGLMLRDDIYLPTKNASIISNYVSAGILCAESSTTALFYRENTTLSKGQAFASSLPAVGDVYTFTIERVGQSVTVTVTCGDKTVSTTHYDFDFFAKDNGYMYVGMFANRGTVVEFTNVDFEITGTSQGA